MGTSTSISFVDGGLAAGKVYIYRVRAVDADGKSASAYCDPDPVSTLSFTTAPAIGGVPSLAQFDEGLQIVNALRAAHGAAAFSWSGILPASTPPPQTGGIIRVEHLAALRRSMDQSLSELGIPIAPYTGPNVASNLVLIRAVHLLELRTRVQ